LPEQNHPRYDYLIIGQGLAGSLLAHRLITLGNKILVIDNAHHNSASQVAAGLINPLTGHRLNLTNQFEAFFQIAKATYQQLNEEYQLSIYTDLKQTRLIKNAGQADYYQQRKTQNEYKSYLTEANEQSLIDAGYLVDAGFGCTGVNHTAVVDTKLLLQTIKSHLLEQNAYRQSQVDYQQLKITKSGVCIGDLSAKKIIFCEGHQAINNPWLTKLPFKLSKGDVLTIKTNMPANTLLSWGNWLVSDAHGTQAKLGSTYAWNDLDLTKAPVSCQQLIESLNKHTTITSSLIKHEVGIRPTTVQRKPFIGPITNLDNAYCFNGFGSKGCLLIPYYAELLSEHLRHSTPLPNELSQWL